MISRLPLARLHRDDGGQISFIMIFGAVAFVALVGMLFTTGDQAARKIQTQNAADAAVLSGGAWIARGLNVTSAINVIQSQLVAGAILLNTLEITLEKSKPLMMIELAGYKICAAIPYTAAICVPLVAIVEAQLTALNAVLPAVKAMANLLSKCDNGLFWVIAKALEWVNTAVHYSFFFIAAAEAFDVARDNGAEGAVLVPGPLFHLTLAWDGLFLPTEKADFSQLCEPMKDGTKDGKRGGYSKLLRYPFGQGPYELGKCRMSWMVGIITGVPPVGWFLFPVIAERQKDMLCDGKAWEPVEEEIKRPAASLQECRALDGTAKWSVVTIRTRRFSAKLSDPWGWFDGKLDVDKLAADPDYLDTDPDVASVSGHNINKKCSWTPPGKKVQEGEYRELQPVDTYKISDDPERYEYRYTIKVWSLVETEVTVTEKVEENPLGGKCGNVKPNPYLLKDDHDALHFVAVAWRDNRRIFFSPDFLERPPAIYTYGQAEVYNGISHDTFTQDWRVRLERASLLEAPFKGLSGDQLGEFVDFLNRFFGPDDSGLGEFFPQVNNH